MPQKPSKFQSKSRSGGGNFSTRGGKGGEGSRGGFSKRFEGDKKSGDRDERRGYGRGDDRAAGKSRGSFADRAPGDKKFSDKSSGGSKFGDKKFGDKKFGDKKFGDKSFGDKKFGDKKFGDKKFGDKKFGDKKFGDKSFGDKKFGDKKFGDKKFGDKKFGDKSFGDKKFGDKKFGDKKFGDKKFGDRPRRERAEYAPSYAPASAETREKLKSQRPAYGAPSPAYLYGVHAVTQAVLNPERQHKRLLVTERGLASLQKALSKAAKEGLSVPEATLVESEDIARLLPRDAVHQDVLLDTQPLEEVFLQDILLHVEENACVVVLDQVTDPHNVGAILRSAAAFGAIAVVVQKLHAPDVTGVLAKAASGAVEHVPIVREVNLARTITHLRDAGFTCIGLAERGEATLAGCKPGGKVAVVLGAEGDGLRRLVAESCDMLARLPTGGEVASLNVSNAAAVALYELARLRD